MTEPTYPGAEAAERAAAMLTAAGMPRMASRVMMALVGSPDEGYSASELAERLGVSAAAVSGAVRYLQTIRIVHRLSRAGDRRDRYDLVDDGWHAVLLANAPLYEMLADGIDLVADENGDAPLSVAARTGHVRLLPILRGADAAAPRRVGGEAPGGRRGVKRPAAARADPDQPPGVSVVPS